MRKLFSPVVFFVLGSVLLAACTNSDIEDLEPTNDFPSIRFETASLTTIGTVARGTTLEVPVVLSQASSRDVSVRIRVNTPFPGAPAAFVYWQTDADGGNPRQAFPNPTINYSGVRTRNPAVPDDNLDDIVVVTGPNLRDVSTLIAGVRIPTYVLTIPAGQTRGNFTIQTRATNPAATAPERIALQMLPAGPALNNVVGNAYFAPDPSPFNTIVFRVDLQP